MECASDSPPLVLDSTKPGGNLRLPRLRPRCVRPFSARGMLLTSPQFKLEALTQQLELAKSEAERAAAELATKSEELAKYRRTKHAELAQLQVAHDSLAQTYVSTESSLKALQSARTAQSHQFTQALMCIQDLKGQLAEQEATYSSEAAGLRSLVAVIEEREAQAKAIVDSIKKDSKRVQELQAVLDR